MPRPVCCVAVCSELPPSTVDSVSCEIRGGGSRLSDGERRELVVQAHSGLCGAGAVKTES